MQGKRKRRFTDLKIREIQIMHDFKLVQKPVIRLYQVSDGTAWFI
jgi:hypothetical protein